MDNWKDQARDLFQQGLFRATTGCSVLAGFGQVWSQEADDEVLDSADFHATEKVQHVDVFVSHSWSADPRAKHLAMCFFLNFRLAIKSVAVAIVCSQCLAFVIPDLSTTMLFLLLMDVPVLVFFGVFFFGHHLTRGSWYPSLWVDKLCVDQASVESKSRGIKGLPAIVAASSEMLVLWDQTYFERLWCNFELSIFVKCHGVQNLRFVPLWLAPWLLLTMLFAYVSCRLIAIAHGTNPNFGLDSAEAHSQVVGTSWEYGVQRMLGYLPDTQVYAMFYIPALIVSLEGFQKKLKGHQMMLLHMADFDIRAVKCSVQGDREVIEMQVAELFDGTEDAAIRLSSEPHEEQQRLSLSTRLAVRSVLGFPEVGACLDAFNEYVRYTVRDAVIEDLGTETHLPWGICVLTWMPTVLCLTAIAWTG